MARILIIDDDKVLSKVLSIAVKELGHEVVCEFTLQNGLDKAFSQDFDVVFLDVNLPDGNGLEALPRIRETRSSPEVIIITGFGDPDGAELAIKNGAWDYVEKPSSLEKMTLPLVRALQYREKARKVPVSLKREGLVGNSPQIRACLDLVAQAASSDANVLITGETGTGKELFAWAIHENSDRRDKDFVVVDSATLPESLVESMLFGYEKGAFTGANQSREGLIKQADKGTLFLDEVGELPLPVQKAFLRVLQEHRFRPLGGKKEVKSDFRLVAATHRDLNEMVKNDAFREDLLFRIQTMTIQLPPLRERLEDIRELVIYHMDRICNHYMIETKGISPDFFDALLAFDWPGNVRELVNVLERTFSLARHEPVLFARHLPTHIRVQAARASIRPQREVPIPEELDEIHSLPPTLPTLRDFRETTDQRYLQKLMSVTGRDIQQACRISGLSRARLYQLIKKHGV